MKKMTGMMVAGTVALAVFLTGVAWAKSAPQTSPKTLAKSAEVKKEEKKAEVKSADDADKSEALMMMETRLKDLDARIKAAEATIATAPVGDKPGLETKMGAVKAKRAEVDPKLLLFKEAAADKWMDARIGARIAIDDTQKEFMSLLSSNKLFAKEEKDEYEAEAMDQLKMNDIKIKKLEADAVKAKGDAKKQADKALVDVKAKRADADAKLKKVRDAKLADWKALKADSDKALKDLGDVLK